ncbi:MAG: class I SAM-dependent methyltransferase [Acidobacteria bacterium]|nr:class I SAM-dependent methyltransferase [Acidobacteriota bacterium]
MNAGRLARAVTMMALLLLPAAGFADSTDELKLAQERFEGAFQTRDVAALASLLHEGFVDFPFDGETPVDWSAKNPEERSALLRGALERYESWSVRLINPTYRVAGSTGVVSGWENVTRKPRVGVLEYPRWRFTATWTHEDGKWRMIAMHRSTTPATIPGGVPAAADPAEQRILSTALDAPRFANVPLVDARLLRVLAEAAGAKHIVELGTSTGFSALWFCNALRKSGGRLTTFELDPRRAKIAREQFQKAGVENIVTLVEGDAHENIKALKGPIDLVFIDAEKDGYPAYLEQLLPLVRAGGLIVAHNMRWPTPSAAYVKAVTSNPALETVFVNMDDQGLSLTLKKR